jgi:hypothetical protein
MSGIEDCRTSFDNLKLAANNSFNIITSLPLFGVGWEEQFAKVK